MYKIVTDVTNLTLIYYPVLPDANNFMKDIWPKFHITVNPDNFEEFILVMRDDPTDYIIEELKFSDGQLLVCQLKLRPFYNYCESSMHFLLEISVIDNPNKNYTILLDEDFFGREIMAKILEGYYND